MKQGDERYALYDLASDPSESNNLVEENPKRLRSMIRGIGQELKSPDAIYPVKDGRRLEPVTPQEKKR